MMVETSSDDTAQDADAAAAPRTHSATRKHTTSRPADAVVDQAPPSGQLTADAPLSSAASAASSADGGDAARQRAQETVDAAAQRVGGWMHGAVGRVRGEALSIWDEARAVRARWHTS